MNTNKFFTIVSCITLMFSCSQKDKSTTILVKNTLALERSFETIELSKGVLKVEDLSVIGIRDTENNELQITQTVDTNGDGEMDQLLFQPKLPPSSEKAYEIVILTTEEQPKATAFCYSRFVPERTDDYTWENNKVAFRVYGPTAQKMAEDSVPGGTLSSGVDAWLKKVEYPVINKWYKKTTEGTGSYHEDTGEGLDNFHVGISRGVGGIGIKKDDKYYFSKNFTKWKTITTGPIRASFYLEYEDWDAGGKLIKESKIISLDKGNNLMKFETFINGNITISVGLTLHEKDGEVTKNNKHGWISYWQPHGESELGTAIVASPHSILNLKKYEINIKDLSNAYAQLKIKNNKVVYYAGFGWKESGQFKNRQEWEDYLNRYAKQINEPLIVIYESSKQKGRRELVINKLSNLKKSDLRKTIKK